MFLWKDAIPFSFNLEEIWDGMTLLVNIYTATVLKFHVLDTA